MLTLALVIFLVLNRLTCSTWEVWRMWPKHTIEGQTSCLRSAVGCRCIWRWHTSPWLLVQQTCTNTCSIEECQWPWIDRHLHLEKKFCHGQGRYRREGVDLPVFLPFCSMEKLEIVSPLIFWATVFPHKNILKKAWTSPDGQTENQIDHITVVRK